VTRAKTDCCCLGLKLYVLSISARDNGHIYMDRKEVGLVAVEIAVVLVAAEAAVVAVVTIASLLLSLMGIEEFDRSCLEELLQ